MRTRQSLNGWWDYRIGEGRWTKIRVPCSVRPVGRSEYALDFKAAPHRRAFLVLEGITYAAEVTLNGKKLGDMLPYCEYRFEVTDILSEENHLSVIIEDIAPVFGPSEGWENYGGIIRGVYVEYTGDSFIEDVVWSTTFEENYTTAHCRVEVAADASPVTVRLLDPCGRCVGSAAGEGVLTFDVDAPALWSPDSPALYTLEVSAGDDVRTEKVGFKDFTVSKKRFLLNGQPLFLLGVDRHDLWGDQGHTLTEEQMQRDMRMIKETGVNYVRLVHYPHSRRILEIADEIGLLVSEEPGLWWSDMNNPALCDGALEVMRRTVLRDRNHISIAFWLSFNECIFTMEYLKDSVRVCREADPYHMVSGANCMSNEMTKENYPKCGFDFYTMHPYAATPDRMTESAKVLDDMPLLLTEWGGWYMHDNPLNFRWFINTIVDYWNHPDDQPVIAGATYWCWSEIYEFSRGGNACQNGFLKEGLVDAWRNPTPDLDVFTSAFRRLRMPPEPQECAMTVLPIHPAGACKAVDVSALCDPMPAWDKMIAASREHDPRFHYKFKGTRRMDNGPKLCEEIRSVGTLPAALSVMPYVIDGALTIPVNAAASALHIIGNVSMPKGWPTHGSYGETAAEYIVTYTDGTTEVHPMRNGLEITTATAQYGPSRINPVAANCPRALYWHYDFDWEHYIANHCVLPADRTKTVASLTLRDAGNGYHVLFYGLTVEE